MKADTTDSLRYSLGDKLKPPLTSVAEPQPEAESKRPPSRGTITEATLLGGRRRRFKMAERMRVYGRLRDLGIAGLGPQAAAEQMQREGFRMADGSDFDPALVPGVYHYWRAEGIPIAKRSERAKSHLPAQYRNLYKEDTLPVVPAPAPKAVDPRHTGKIPTAVFSILTHPTLPDEKKLSMLKNYLHAARMIGIMTEIADDEALTATEKLAMLMGYVEI